MQTVYKPRSNLRNNFTGCADFAVIITYFRGNPISFRIMSCTQSCTVLSLCIGAHWSSIYRGHAAYAQCKQIVNQLKSPSHVRGEGTARVLWGYPVLGCFACEGERQVQLFTALFAVLSKQSTQSVSRCPSSFPSRCPCPSSSPFSSLCSSSCCCYPGGGFHLLASTACPKGSSLSDPRLGFALSLCLSSLSPCLFVSLSLHLPFSLSVLPRLVEFICRMIFQ